MKNRLVFFILLSLISCTPSKDSNDCNSQSTFIGVTACSPYDVTTIEPISPPDEFTGVPLEAETWNTNLYFVNFTYEQEQKVQKAAELIKGVIASKEFRDRVINFSYGGKFSFVDNKGLSNIQIYQKILNGSETLLPIKNNSMDLEIELFSESSSTIGYTYPTTVRIWMNTKYFNYYTPYDVTDNLMHEWMHKLGFDHAASWSPSRDHSVPYAIGYLVEELSKKLFPEF